MPIALRRLALALVFFGGFTLAVAQVNPILYAGIKWRNIGPLRAGRVAAVTGAIGQPGVFYIGLPGGGVWKTVSAGEVWFPIFDSVKDVACIGSIEVAPSDPNIIYVGTGDLITGGAINEGNGMYKSTDAGKTWEHIGLDHSKQIPKILVDPKNPDIVLVAAQGDVHARSQDRGVYRTTDGGRTWKQVLFVADDIGIQEISWAYDRPDTIFAMTVRHFNQPGGAAGGAGGRGGNDNTTRMYKSTDEGLTWRQVTGPTLPQLASRTSVAVAAHTNGQRVYTIGGYGLYRSDDGGATWRRMDASDGRITGSTYICDVYVDPKDPDIVYTMNTSMYRSTDGGETFASFKGAPGGDDNHVLWIDSTDHTRMLLGSDQGAVVSFDGGHTWSSWYNQATAQVYHIAVDHQFPYWVWATQQDSGSVGTRSRGNLGEITPLDWYPLAGYEWGYVAVDPLNNNIVYSGSEGNGEVKIVAPSGQSENIAPNIGPTDYRPTNNHPVMFSPIDPHLMFFGSQKVSITRDGGLHWKDISPDLTTAPEPASPSTTAPAGAPPSAAARGGAGVAGGRGGRGTLSTIAPSSVRLGVVWAGSSTTHIHVTQDMENWHDVTPPDTTGDITYIEASHFDAATAYAANDRHGSGDYKPYIYRTRDFGKTWDLIVSGLPTDEPSGSFVRVVKEDPVRKGLLFAGTESSMYVSFDDGNHWQSLRLNLPNTSFRDAVIHGNDMVVGTYGRSFWVLDDISPLRQINESIAASENYLFKPDQAIRVYQNVNGDTPLPPEVPHADNPPPGAIIYYYLSVKPADPITLEILDAAGRHVRTLSSAAINEVIPPQPVPDYWLGHPQVLDTDWGTNRAYWDFHYDPPKVFSLNYAQNMGALFEDTLGLPEGPMAPPGLYTIKLTVAGKSYTQPLNVVNDPRSPGTAEDFRLQAQVVMPIYHDIAESYDAFQQVSAMRAQLQGLSQRTLPPAVAEKVTALDAKLAPVEGTRGGGRRGGGGFAGRGAAPAGAQAFSAINGSLSGLMGIVDSSDMAPTEAQRKAFQAYCGQLRETLTLWKTINLQDVPALNSVLTQSELPPLTVPKVQEPPMCATETNSAPAKPAVPGGRRGGL